MTPGTRLYNLFHTLWTRAVGTPEYNREDWHKLSGLLETTSTKRKINDMFHVDSEGFLVKTSNGQRVPEDEPVFILRGRDTLSLVAIESYIGEMEEMGCDRDRINDVRTVAKDFLNFTVLHPERMKQPGITKGK
jgi:hypothetical protein